MEKTKEQLEDEIRLRDLRDELLKTGDSRWATKLVEVIVYSLCALILTGAIVAILSLIYNKPHV